MPNRVNLGNGLDNSKTGTLQEGDRPVHERDDPLLALDAAIARGITDADAGRVKPAATVFDRLEAKYNIYPKD